MTEPKSTPCKGCQDKRPIYTDGEDFWKWDPESNLFRVVDHFGEFYALDIFPGVTEPQLVYAFKESLYLATEADIIWRTTRMILTGLMQAGHSNF